MLPRGRVFEIEISFGGLRGRKRRCASSETRLFALYNLIFKRASVSESTSLSGKRLLARQREKRFAEPTVHLERRPS